VSPRDYSEDGLVERPTLALLESLGYEVADGYSETLGPDGLGRDDQSQVVLRHRLAPKLAELNPDLPSAAIDAAIDELVLDRSALDSTRANRAVHELLRGGVKVTVTDEHGDRTTETVRVVDWKQQPTTTSSPSASSGWSGRSTPGAATSSASSTSRWCCWS